MLIEILLFQNAYWQFNLHKDKRGSPVISHSRRGVHPARVKHGATNAAAHHFLTKLMAAENHMNAFLIRLGDMLA